MRADVERQVDAGRARCVERSRAIEVERHGIEHQPLGRPRGHLETRRDLHGDAAAGRGREAVGLHGCQPRDGRTLHAGALPAFERPLTPDRHERGEEARRQQAGRMLSTHARMLARGKQPAAAPSNPLQRDLLSLPASAIRVRFSLRRSWRPDAAAERRDH